MSSTRSCGPVTKRSPRAFRLVASRFAAALGCAALALSPRAAAASSPSPSPATRAQTWLFVSDIHLDPLGSRTEPSPGGRDTSPALFDSALVAMRAAAPNPSVVAIEGDLLAHRLAPALAAPTVASIARRFAAAFPHARFLIALGNNDSGCEDYGVGFDSPFLAAAAKAWAPLVERGGASPTFATTFAHDGFARVALPIPHTSALVLDDTYGTPRYRDACKTNARPDAIFTDVQRAIDTGPAGERYWIVAHVPPGIDAFSTAFAHGVVEVPFLRPSFTKAFVGLAQSGRVTFALAGHTHKFAYRVVDANGAHPFALLGVPGLSPIFHNAPAFLTATVDAGGTLRRVREHAFDGTAWHDIGGFPTLGVDAVTPAALVALQARLARDPSARAEYARLYDAGGTLELNERNWRYFVCAATELDAAPYRRCTGRPGFDPLTPRGLALAIAALTAVLGFVVLLVMGLVRRRARRGVAR